MLFAFRIIMSQAILRLRKVQAARVSPARHGPPALVRRARRARRQLVHHPVRHSPHHGALRPGVTAPLRAEVTEQPPRPR
jgi:hypothetical protein